MAREGADVVAVDLSGPMLAEARRRIRAAGLAHRVSLVHLDVARLAERFEGQRFDLIVASLVLGELPPPDRRLALAACRDLLAPGGCLLIGDEVSPAGRAGCALYRLARGPLLLLTWLLTGTTTHPLGGLRDEAAGVGLDARHLRSWLGGSLALYACTPTTGAAPPGAAGIGRAQPASLPEAVAGRLRHRTTPRTVALDLWALLFRIVPPYPKVRPGVYAVGGPHRGSPVLVTGNYDLTVRRLVRGLDGRVDAWLLVVDSAGINVWCAAGGGFLTAEKIIAAARSARLSDIVDHHSLILPQLAANGVDGWRIRRELGWGVHWGPVRAEDVPAYLFAGREKTDEMRRVAFPLRRRLEMVTVTLGFYGLLILPPVFALWRHLLWPVAASLVALSYFHATVLPWLPGRDGLAKSLPLALITLAGYGAYRAAWAPAPPATTFRWAVGLVALSVLVAAEFQGMSPRMRGEQANWYWEAVIGAALAAAFALVPPLMGWR
jgi:hypothetical protein